MYQSAWAKYNSSGENIGGFDGAWKFFDATGAPSVLLDHGSLSGLLDDDHTQYLLLAGRAGSANDAILSTTTGGQLAGSSASGQNLTLTSTTHATKSKLLFGTSAYDEVNNRLGIRTATPGQPLDIVTAAGAIGWRHGDGVVQVVSFLDSSDAFGWLGVATNQKLVLGANGQVDGSANIVLSTDGKVAINRLTPGARLDVLETSASGNRGFLLTESNNSVSGFAFITRKDRGDGVTPAIVANGDELGVFIFRGYDGANYKDSGAIQFAVDGTPGINDMPGKFLLYTTPDGSGTTEVKFTINSRGIVGIGNDVTPPSTGTLGLIFADGTALSSMAANTAGLYADDVSGIVRMFAIDEDSSKAELQYADSYAMSFLTAGF